MDKLLIYSGEFRGFKTFNIYKNLSGKDKKLIAGTLFKIAKEAAEPAYRLSGINVDLIEKMLSEKYSNSKIISNFKIELRSIVMSYLAFKNINLIPSGFPFLEKGKYKTSDLIFAFEYDSMLGIKKLNTKKAKDYEGSAFFSFVFENSLKYGFRLLNVKPKKIELKGRGILKFLGFKVETIEEKWGYYLACKELINKKAKWVAFPSPIMLIKAYPDLKVRRR